MGYEVFAADIIFDPTIFLGSVVVYNLVTGTYAFESLYISRDWMTVIILLPVLAFAASTAMVLIKKTLAWRIAVLINGVPLLLVLLASFLVLGR